MKNVALIISGRPGNNVHELELHPGTTAGDALASVGLGSDYLLSVEGSGNRFAAEEPIYDAVAEGAKLRATPVAEVGERTNLTTSAESGMWRRMVRIITRLLGGRPAQQQPARAESVNAHRANVRTKPARVAGQVSGTNGGRIAVQPSDKPYWIGRGWRRRGNRLVGAYRTARLSVAGEIELDQHGRPTFFVVNPPKSVLVSKHGPCFRPRGTGRFWIHFNRGHDIDGGILAVEQIVAQALQTR